MRSFPALPAPERPQERGIPRSLALAPRPPLRYPCLGHLRPAQPGGRDAWRVGDGEGRGGRGDGDRNQAGERTCTLPVDDVTPRSLARLARPVAHARRRQELKGTPDILAR